ncbi:MAG: DUF1569 domain-containing protein [Vicingaceae bacterium]
MKSLDRQVELLASYFSQSNAKNLEVSSVPIIWHLDHSLRVINSITRALEQSDPLKFKRNFNFWRIVFFTTKYIPRGKAKAPQQVKPEQQINFSELKKRLNYALENIEKLTQLPNNAHFPHPYFGQLNLKQSKKFIRIHTKHHLKIIEDILK